MAVIHHRLITGLLAVLVVGSACSGDGSSMALEEVDLTITLAPDTTDDDLAAISRAVEELDGVAETRTLTPDEVGGLYLLLIGIGENADRVRASDFGPAIYVWFDGLDRDAVLDRVDGLLLLPEVDTVAVNDPPQVVRRCLDRFEMIVWFEPLTPTNLIDEVGDRLAAYTVVFFDSEAAYEEFAHMFADEPDMVATVSPDVMPPSLRVDLGDEPAEAEIAALATEFEALPYVKTVIDNRGLLPELCR